MLYIFFLNLFIVGVLKGHWFLKVDFVSCYIAEAVYGAWEFLGRVFGSLRYRIMSSGNRDTLTISLPICIHFISSSCLIPLARNSRLCWMRVRIVGTLVSLLIYGEMVSVFLHLVQCHYMSFIAFIMLRCIPSTPSFLKAFIMNGVESYQSLFLHLLMWSSGFCPCFY
jgi:hypothetical protein